jgi:PEP-CTERM motif
MNRLVRTHVAAFAVATAAGLLSAPAPAQAQLDIVLTCQAVSQSPPNPVCATYSGGQPGSATASASSPNIGTATVTASVDYGRTSISSLADVSTGTTPPSVFVLSSVGASVRWTDSFVATGVAPGQDVQVRMTIDFSIDSFSQGATGSALGLETWGEPGGALPNDAPSFIGRLDACFANGTQSCGGFVEPLGDGLTRLTVDFTVAADAQFDWRSSISAGSGAFSTLANDVYSNGLNADVHQYFDVLTTGASLDWASGHDYRLTSATPVPEPATSVLVAAGLAALALRRRRRVSR